MTDSNRSRATVVVLYNHPTDSEAFDRYYRETHTPLTKKIPELRSFEVNRGPIGTPDGPAPFHKIAVLTFDSMADLQAGLGSPEGQAVVADLANFATGGVTPLIFERGEV